MGEVHDVAEDLIVPDDSLSIREGAIAAWPGAWQGANLRSVVSGLGIDIDKPFRKLRKRDRDWLLYTDEQPAVLVEPERDRVDYGYHGTFWSARKHVLHTLATSKSERMRERALGFTRSVPCPTCGGSGIRPEALRVSFAGRSIAEMNALPLDEAVELLRPVAALDDPTAAVATAGSGETSEVAVRICADLVARIEVLLELGLGYLSLGRSSTTLSPGEIQRLRIATQLRSGLFGVVYVLDEPSAGLHPADAEPLLAVLDRLKEGGNSLFVVEHDLDVVRRADWVVDIGPGAGEAGGRVLYSGPVPGLADVPDSVTGAHLFGRVGVVAREPREPQGCLRVEDISRNNLDGITAEVPLCVLTAITGVSGSGKSTLLAELAAADGLDEFDRLVVVDQRPIGRTPRSNLATYTGMFDAVRKVFAATPSARRRRYDPGRFSFNLPDGRCATCKGDGFVEVELLFIPGTYAPCPTCEGSRYNDKTLEVTYEGKTIADVLALTVDDAAVFLADLPAAARSLETLREVGLGYLRLGQPATELSGGEAQRIKLATELQRARRGHACYLLDEPTTGLHPADVELLLRQLHRLVDAGNTVVVVEHDLGTIASADWVVDLGPGGGDAGGRVVAAGRPGDVARCRASATGRYLRRHLDRIAADAA